MMLRWIFGLAAIQPLAGNAIYAGDVDDRMATIVFLILSGGQPSPNLSPDGQLFALRVCLSCFQYAHHGTLSPRGA